MRESAAFGTPTLSPVGVLGLQSNQLPLALDGYSDTFIARWDAEWNSHVFTSVDYQHQDLTNLSIPNPGLIDTIPLTDGSLDRVSATANVWLEHGFGAFGTIAHLDSQNETPGFDGPLPFVPEIAGRVGLTWVNPANLKVTLAATYVGERDGDLAGTQLDDYWTAMPSWSGSHSTSASSSNSPPTTSSTRNSSWRRAFPAGADPLSDR